MNKIEKTKVLPYFLISLTLHFIGLIILNQLIDFSKPTDQYARGEVLKIKSIKRNYKNIGVKNGNKKYDVMSKIKKGKKKSEMINFSSLKIFPSQNQLKINKKVSSVAKSKSKKIHYFINQKSKSEIKIQKRFLKKISYKDGLDPVLSNSDFALNPELPEGFKEDELNTADKVFYSFKKRTLEQYLASFVGNYQDFKRSKPSIKSRLKAKKHRLSGRITFDKKGNIVTIKIIKSSEDDDIHSLFEETLKGINKVPNPPVDFLTKDDQFSIYYVLQIN